MKKLIIATAFMTALSGCVTISENDPYKDMAIEYVTSSYKNEYNISVSEDEYLYDKGRFDVRRFYIDVETIDFIDHWCVIIAIEQDGTIWNIDADKRREFKNESKIKRG